MRSYPSNSNQSAKRFQGSRKNFKLNKLCPPPEGGPFAPEHRKLARRRTDAFGERALIKAQLIAATESTVMPLKNSVAYTDPEVAWVGLTEDQAKAKGKILGGGMVGTHAGDMIGEIALAIEMGADAVDIGKTIHSQPTLGEGIGMAAEVVHGSCTDLPPMRKWPFFCPSASR